MPSAPLLDQPLDRELIRALTSITAGLLARGLPSDVIEILHTAAKTGGAVQPLPPDVQGAFETCRSWADLAALRNLLEGTDA